MTQHLERLALKLHSSYITSELCRPALKESSLPRDPSTTAQAQSPSLDKRKTSQSSTTAHSPISSTTEPHTRSYFRQRCIEALEGTVAAYVELHSLSKFAARSWIGIQRSISAAFLLGTLPETNQDPNVLGLLRNLEEVIGQRTVEDLNLDGTQAPSPVQRRLSLGQQIHGQAQEAAAAGQFQNPPPLVDGPQWAKSMSRSLHALGKLNAALAAPKPVVAGGGRHQGQNQGASYPNSSHANLYIKANLSPTATQSAHANRTQYPFTTIKDEPYSPAMASASTNHAILGSGIGLGGLNGGPITPDSTGSSGEWNYGNMQERAAEYVQAPLWGDGGSLGGYVR
jgi:hypothetical protein